MAHYMLGDEAAARLALQTAVDGGGDFPGKEEARQRLAVLALDAETANAAARTELDNALRRWPQDPNALLRLAQFQIHDGAADQALKILETIIADNPLHHPALRRLALLYGERSSDDSNAYEVVQRARESYPEDADIAKTLGILSYRRGLYPQGAVLLEEATRKLGDDAELFYYLGATQQQLMQWKDCTVALKRALDLKLGPTLADRAKQDLAQCAALVSP